MTTLNTPFTLSNCTLNTRYDGLKYTQLTAPVDNHRLASWPYDNSAE